MDDKLRNGQQGTRGEAKTQALPGGCLGHVNSPSAKRLLGVLSTTKGEDCKRVIQTAISMAKLSPTRVCGLREFQQAQSSTLPTVQTALANSGSEAQIHAAQRARADVRILKR